MYFISTFLTLFAYKKVNDAFNVVGGILAWVDSDREIERGST